MLRLGVGSFFRTLCSYRCESAISFLVHCDLSFETELPSSHTGLHTSIRTDSASEAQSFLRRQICLSPPEHHDWSASCVSTPGNKTWDSRRSKRRLIKTWSGWLMLWSPRRSQPALQVCASLAILLKRIVHHHLPNITSGKWRWCHGRQSVIQITKLAMFYPQIRILFFIRSVNYSLKWPMSLLNQQPARVNGELWLYSP